MKACEMLNQYKVQLMKENITNVNSSLIQDTLGCVNQFARTHRECPIKDGD